MATPVHMERRPDWAAPPAGPDIKLMVCGSGRDVGLLNLSVGA